MSRIAIIKIHPGLNMAAAQLSGELECAGHATHIYFFKEYRIEEHYVNESYTWDQTDSLAVPRTTSDYEQEYTLLATELRKFDPQAIGLTLHSLSLPEAIKTTRFLKDTFGVPVLWGGAGPTLEPELSIQHADMVCVGEGEAVMVEFAHRLQAGQDWTDIAGTWARATDGTVIQNPKRPMLDLDTIAIPNWNRASMTYISDDKVLRGGAVSKVVTGTSDYQIMTQRGCPFSCSFCIESRYQEMFGKKNSLRRRSVDLVLAELVQAKALYKPERIWFWDDVFTVNPRWLKAFLPQYKEQVGIPFWCYTYPTTHNLELLQLLKDAGCNSLTMGIQSGSARLLEGAYNRPTPLKRVLEASQEIIDAGIIGYFDLISKSEFETEADLRATFEFLVDLPAALIYGGAAEMRSYPSYSYTKKVKDAKAENIISTATRVDDKTYDYYHNLYWVARNPHISKAEKLAIAADRRFRDEPELLTAYIFGRRTIHETIFQMLTVTSKGIHPDILFPPAPYATPAYCLPANTLPRTG